MQAVKNKTISLLRWAEQYTKTDMVYLAHGGFWLTLGQLLVFAASAVLVWIFANFLPKEVYGQYRFLTSAAALFGLFALPGMGMALVQTIARGNLATTKTVVRAQMRWALLGSAVSIAGAVYYGLAGNVELAIAFAIIAFFLPFYSPFSSYQQHLQGIKDFRRGALYFSLQRGFVVVCIGATIFLSKNLLLILAVALASSSVADLMLLRSALKKHPPTGQDDAEAISYGKRLSLIAAFRIGAQYLDKLLLWYFAGPIQVATYAIAAAPPNEITSVLGHVNRLALPKMSAQNIPALRHALLRKIGVYLIAIIPIILAYIFAAPIIFKFIFPQYVEAVSYTQLLALLLLFLPSGLFAQYFYATRHLRAINTVSILEPSLLLVSYMFLVPTLGIYGVILANIVRSIGSVLLSLFFFTRDKRIMPLTETPSLSQ